MSSRFDFGLFLALSSLDLVLVRLFLFPFNSHIIMWCVVNALIKGEIEDQERPRTGGWSLLCDE